MTTDLTRLGAAEMARLLAAREVSSVELTAMYLARLLKPLGLHVTRIASGLPVGGAAVDSASG